MTVNRSISVVAFLIALVQTFPASALTLGQTDTFEDGTTRNWGSGAPNPVPPVTMASGGPAGLDDHYLQLRSLGGGGPGSRLVAMNSDQWSGDYDAAGITGIRMDVNNIGATDLSLRLMFLDSDGLPTPQEAVSSIAIFVPSGSGWMSILFPTAASDLTALTGSVDAALSGADSIRLFHGPSVGFPPAAIVATLGVDNVTAVPEPASVLLFAAGIGLLTASFRRRRRTTD